MKGSVGSIDLEAGFSVAFNKKEYNTGGRKKYFNI